MASLSYPGQGGRMQLLAYPHILLGQHGIAHHLTGYLTSGQVGWMTFTPFEGPIVEAALDRARECYPAQMDAVGAGI